MSLHADVCVVRDGFTLALELGAAAGEVVAVLGPNGAGKSTLLGTLAGLVPLQRGRVELDGRVLEDTATGARISPEDRPVGVVFQEYRLFPHLSVLDNVAFGLRCRGAGRAAARRAAQRLLLEADLAPLAAARPTHLSGGQAQRVALLRALAPTPALLLLDEPLAALDARARVETRRALRAQLAAFGGVKILVTHDPVEAMALADRLIVLEAGRVVQTGPAADVTARPRSAWVAALVGVNLLRGRGGGDRVLLDGGATLIVPGAGEGDVLVVIHPRAVALHRVAPEGTPRNVWRATIASLDSERDRVRVRTTGAIPVVAEITAAAVAALRLAPGIEVWVSIKAMEISVYPA